jgi:hypothetical protein
MDVRALTRIVTMSVLLIGAIAHADISPTKERAAEACLSAINSDTVLRDAVDSVATRVPADQQMVYRGLMGSQLSAQQLHGIMKQALLDTYTDSELQALARFYATPEGHAIAQKMGPFTGQVLGAVAQRVLGALPHGS